MLSARTTVVIAPTAAADRGSLLPTLICTSAPGTGPNVTCTELRRTVRPISRIKPEPRFRPPKTGSPRYHCVFQAVARVLSIAKLAFVLASSNPCARSGLSATEARGQAWRARPPRDPTQAPDAG